MTSLAGLKEEKMQEITIPIGLERRKEDYQLITGRARYVDDVRLPEERPGQVFVEFMEAGREARQEIKQRFKMRIRAIFAAMSDEGRASLLLGLEEFVCVGQEVGEDAVPSMKGETYGC
jgi:hypothetical protein